MRHRIVYTVLGILIALTAQQGFMRPGRAQESPQQAWEYELVHVEAKTASILVYSDDVAYMDSILRAPWRCREIEGYCGTTMGMGWEAVLDAWGSDGWELVDFETISANWLSLVFKRPITQ